MVTEFTELQGVMGKEYALLDGESPEVAEAIFEQYLPRFAGDVLPQTEAGKVLSIIDKVDNICCYFQPWLNPYGLSRSICITPPNNWYFEHLAW